MSDLAPAADVLRTLHAFIMNWDWAAKDDDEFPGPDEVDAAFECAIEALEVKP